MLHAVSPVRQSEEARRPRRWVRGFRSQASCLTAERSTPRTLRRTSSIRPPASPSGSPDTRPDRRRGSLLVDLADLAWPSGHLAIAANRVLAHVEDAELAARHRGRCPGRRIAPANQVVDGVDVPVPVDVRLRVAAPAFIGRERLILLRLRSSGRIRPQTSCLRFWRGLRPVAPSARGVLRVLGNRAV
jgi:hypothetical protein